MELLIKINNYAQKRLFSIEVHHPNFYIKRKKMVLNQTYSGFLKTWSKILHIYQNI